MSLIWRAAAARVSDLSRDPLIFIVVVGLILAVPTSLTAQPPIFLNGSAVTETPVPATLDGYTKTWLEPQVVESEQELQIDNLFPVKIVGRPRFDRATQRIELRSLKSAFPAQMVVHPTTLNKEQLASISADGQQTIEPRPPFTRHVILQLRYGYQLPVTLGEKTNGPGFLCTCNLSNVCEQLGNKPGEAFYISFENFCPATLQYLMQWYNNAYSGAPQNPSTGVPELCYSGKYEIVSLPPDLLTVPDWIHNHCDLSVNTLAQLLMKSPPFANQHFEIATPIMVQHLVDAGDELETWDYEVLNQRYLFSGKVIGRLERNIVYSPGFVVAYNRIGLSGLPESLYAYSSMVAERIAKEKQLSWLADHDVSGVCQSRLFVDANADRAIPLRIDGTMEANSAVVGKMANLKPLNPGTRMEDVALILFQLQTLPNLEQATTAYAQFVKSDSPETIAERLQKQLAEIDLAEAKAKAKQQIDLEQSKIVYPTTYPNPEQVSLNQKFTINITPTLSLSGTVILNRELQEILLQHSEGNQFASISVCIKELDEATRNKLNDAFKLQNIDLATTVKLESPDVRLRIGGREHDVTLIKKLKDGFVVSSANDETCRIFQIDSRKPFVIPRKVLSPSSLAVLDKWFESNTTSSDTQPTTDLAWLMGDGSVQAMALPRDQVEVGEWLAKARNIPMDQVVIGLANSPALDKLAQDPDVRLAIAIEMAADSCQQHAAWVARLYEQDYDFQGEPVGRLENGYAFAPGFFVACNELSPICLSVLSRQITLNAADWINRHDVKTVYRTRLGASGKSCVPYRLAGTEEINFAYRGTVVQLKNRQNEVVRSENVGPARMKEWLEALPEIERFESFVDATAQQERTAKLKGRFTPLELDSKNDEAIIRNMARTWVFSEPNESRVVSFNGVLKGSVGDQLAFSYQTDADAPMFLVSLSDFPEETRKHITVLLEKQSTELDRSKIRVVGGHPFRLFYVKESNFLHANEPIAVIRAEVGLLSFHRWNSANRMANKAPIRKFEERRLIQLLAEDIEFTKTIRQGATAYALRDSDVAFDGKLASVGRDDAVFTDPLGKLVRVNKMHLDRELIARIDSGTEKMSGTEMSESDIAKLPILLIGRSKHYGPGTLIVPTKILKDTVELQLTDGDTNSIRLGNLTLRQSLALQSMVAAKLANHPLTTIDEEIARPISKENVIRSVPDLRGELADRLKRYLPQAPTKWVGEELTVSPDWVLQHVQHNGERALFMTPNGEIQYVHLGMKKSIKLPEFPRNSSPIGPWIAVNRVVWVVADGKLLRLQYNQATEKSPNSATPGNWLEVALGAADDQVIAADISANGQFLWAQLERNDSERRFVRLSLLTGGVLELTHTSDTAASPASPSGNTATVPRVERLVADRDGGACAVKFPDYFAVVKPRADAETPPADSSRQQVPESIEIGLLTKIGPTRMVLGNGYLIFQQARASSIQVQKYSQPSNHFTASLGNDIATIGFCNSNRKTFAQVIARGTDKYRRDQQICEVSFLPIDDWRRQQRDQVLVGTFDEHSQTTYDGLTWFHRKDGKHYRTVAGGPVTPNFAEDIDSIVATLYRDGDVGQLEALFLQANRDDKAERGVRPGGAGQYVLDSLESLALSTHLEAGGDALDRCERYLWHLRSKYPNSEVINLLMVCWHVRMAWDYRGGGFANTVTEKGWRLFKEHLGAADDLIQSLLNRPEPSPEVFAKAVQIHMGLQRTPAEMELLKERVSESGVKRNPTIHTAIMFASLPRWGGEPGEADRYLTEMTDELGADGPLVYAATLASFTENNFEVTTELDIDVERLVAGTIDYYDVYTDPKVLEASLMQLARLRDFEQCDRLLRLRAEKAIGSSRISANAAELFNQINSIPDQIDALRSKQEQHVEPN